MEKLFKNFKESAYNNDAFSHSTEHFAPIVKVQFEECDTNDCESQTDTNFVLAPGYDFTSSDAEDSDGEEQSDDSDDDCFDLPLPQLTLRR